MYLIAAYNQVYLQFSEREKQFSSGDIKHAMQPFLDQVEMRNDLMFFERLNPGICQALGTNRMNKGQAAILVLPGFYEADQQACSWVIKHEIQHIKSGDPFTMQCVPGICQLASIIFAMYYGLPLLLRLIFIPTITVISLSLFSKYREAKADDFAIKHSSNEELKGGRRFLMALQKTNIENRNTFWNRIIFSAQGENRCDILHPSLASRIQKIERALRDRKVQIDDTLADKEQFALLQSYLADKILMIN